MQDYLKEDMEVSNRYRWSTTSPIEMSDERKEDSFICQIKKVAKELGLRG